MVLLKITMRFWTVIIFLCCVLDNLIFCIILSVAVGVKAQRNSKQKGMKMNKIIPAFYRQGEIKAQIAESKMRKYLIDLNDKNIPAVIRKEIQQEIEANPDLQIFVLKNQMQMFAEQTKKILAEVQKLNNSLSK